MSLLFRLSRFCSMRATHLFINATPHDGHFREAINSAARDVTTLWRVVKSTFFSCGIVHARNSLTLIGCPRVPGRLLLAHLPTNHQGAAKPRLSGPGPFPDKPCPGVAAAVGPKGQKKPTLARPSFPDCLKGGHSASAILRGGEGGEADSDPPGRSRPREAASPQGEGRGRSRDYRALSQFWRESRWGGEGGLLLLLLPGFLVATTTVAMAPSVFPHRGNCCYPSRRGEGGMGCASCQLDDVEIPLGTLPISHLQQILRSHWFCVASRAGCFVFPLANRNTLFYPLG